MRLACPAIFILRHVERSATSLAQRAVIDLIICVFRCRRGFRQAGRERFAGRVELLAARIALLAIEVASESWTPPRGPIVGWNAAVTVPNASASTDDCGGAVADSPCVTGGAPALWVFSLLSPAIFRKPIHDR